MDIINTEKFEVQTLLSKIDCDDFYSAIESFDPSFLISRGHGLKTLGVASYLDVPHPTAIKFYNAADGTLSSYIKKAAQVNPLLINHFEKIYETLCDFFSQRFNVKCCLHKIAGIPGFHIYENHPSFSYQSSHVPHFDKQYEMLYPLFLTKSAQVDYMGKTISFTLPIKLPGCQSGIRFWDLHYQDVQEKNSAKLITDLSEMKPYILQYSVGDLVYHSGHFLHQIKAWSTIINDVPRVTLQGHGLFYNNQLHLYW